SPRRAELMRLLGLKFEIMPADVDERYLRHEAAGAHAQRLAREKALVISEREPDALVIGSDTVVVIDRSVLGKPKSEDEAVEMLMRLQGRVHRVATGIAIARADECIAQTEIVRVKFHGFDESAARAYVATGEPMDKAGAYGIQGFGAALVESVNGDYFAVMGLPLQRMVRMFNHFGWYYNFNGIGRL
ncbi:MAG TPA: Maf family protein, partial [Longimicrobiales bacterium]